MQYYTEEGKELPVLYLGMEQDRIMFSPAYRKVIVPNWNDDLSPWPNPAVFKNGGNFAGHADAFLSELLKMEIPEKCIIAGYSMAGLFALYACTKTDRFIGCVSGSGSFWYPGFAKYIRENPVHCKAVYCSLGGKESHSGNEIMAGVGTETQKIVEQISKYTNITFHEEQGGHFNDPNGRMARGVETIRKFLK